MRKIKFRGIAKPILQNAISGKMVFGSLILNEVGDCFILTDKGDVRVDKDTVGQFIGLLDKNNNEIFEGDIVNAYTLDSGLPIRTGVIEFAEGVFVFRYGNIKVAMNALYTYLLEVIGNIYDNPELINL